MSYLSKENVQGVLELSLVQKGCLSKDFLTQVVYDLQGPLDVKRLEQEWEQMVSLHASLRSVFRKLRNRTVQVLLKQRPISIEWIDLRELNEEEQQTRFQSVATTHLEPIQIEEGPLIRLALFRLEEERTQLLWTHHPLCMDDFSRDMIVEEWLARTKGDQTVQNRKSYQEYLAWEAAQDGMPAKKYWTDQLADFEPTPMLSSIKSNSEKTRRDLRCSSILSEPQSRLLEQIAEQNQVSKEVVTFTAWLLLLQVYSGEDHVSCGVNVSGRPASWRGLLPPIGPFSHSLPMNIKLSANDQVSTLFQSIQQQWKKINEFGYIPIETIRSYVGLEEKTLFFDSCVTVRYRNETNAGNPTLLSRNSRSHVEVIITVGECWKIEFYQSNGNSLADLERLQQHFITLLASISHQSNEQLRSLNLLPEEERKMMVDFNRSKLTTPSLDLLAHQIIENQVKQRPTAIAAICGEEQITYQELNKRANQLAHWLRDQGVGREDLVAILAERSIQMLVGILGVLKAGGAYVPLDSAHPDQRILGILENCQAKVILTESKWQSRSLRLSSSHSANTKVFALDHGNENRADVTTLQSYSIDNPTFINDPSDLANVFFTSGSTGQPKGAMVEHVGMLNHLYAKIHLLQLNENSVVAQNASHCFDISVWQFLAPLMMGGKVVIYTNEIATDPEGLFHSVQRDQVTVLEMVPSIIELFLQVASENEPNQHQLSVLQYMISTGEGLPVSLCNKWLATYPDTKVVNTYGATECSDDTSHEVIEKIYPYEDHPQVALGTSIPNIHHYLLDAWLRPVPVGCVGEVYMTGIGVGRGYLNDPERTQHAYLKNPFADGMGERMYRTGDLARFLPDGRFVFISRADFQVKVRGYRIELGEIEQALLSNQVVSQCLALVKPDSMGNNRILAYTVLHQPTDVLELRQFLQTRLPEYMIPEHILILDKMPLNRNGKIDRKALPEPDGERGRNSNSFMAPRDFWETELVKIWEEVLEIDSIGIDDNFFDLGGHSLKTIQIRSRLKQRMGIDMALKDLFDHQTIRELAPLLKAIQDTEVQEFHIPRIKEAEFYPMSHAQRRLFLLNQLDPNNRSYNMPVAIELIGSFHREAFQHAVQSLVERHEGLRTTFLIHEEEFVQKIHFPYPMQCPIVDWSYLDESLQQQKMSEIQQEEADFCFDLIEGPLFRIRIFKLTDEHHVLWMNKHHIISDFWSWQVLMQDLASFYEAYCKKTAPNLESLTIQYKDYASWQNHQLEDGELKEAESYWTQQFQGELPILELPTDYPRPSIQTFEAAQATYRLEYSQVERIKSLAQKQEATLFMTLLSVVGAFLARMSGQQDIVIGTPEAGRDHTDLENLIGFFVNTLPLRLHVDLDRDFDQLLEHTKRITLDAYTYHDYPFDQLVEKIKPERDLSRSPLFSVMFQLVHSVNQNRMGDLSIRPLSLETNTTNFDLTIVCEETEEGLDIQFQYRTDLFESETIHRWLEHFGMLLEGILDDQQKAISQFPLLNETQYRQLIVEWNDTRVVMPDQGLVHERFAAIAKQIPHAIAVEMENQTLTYSELDDHSDRLAHFLRKKGIGPDVLVGIYVERSIEMVIGLLGILKAGGAYVPIDPSYPQERISYLLADSQVSLLLTQERLLEKLPSNEVDTFCLDRDWSQIASCGDCMPQRKVGMDDLAYMIYTSGSTGNPKGVMIPHRGLINYLSWAIDAYEVEKGIGSIVSSSLAFDATITSLYLPLLAKGRVILLREGEEIEQLSQVLRKHENLSLLKITPAHLQLLNQQLSPEEISGRVRTIVIGGEALSGEDIAFWQEAAPETKLINEYGPTETVVGCAIYHAKEIRQGPVPIGRPISNMQMFVLDSFMQPVPVGVPGELYIGGTGLARGYHNRTELTKERFVPHPFSNQPEHRLYKTGDIVCYRADGNLEYLGRSDHQVKLRGYRIELGEIESKLMQNPTISKATVILREDVPGDKRLVAYVVPNLELQLNIHDLRQYLKDHLPLYMVPAAIIQLDKLPLTANGKVDRRLLPTPDALQSFHSYVPPRDLRELQMVQLWENVLHMKPIGIHDNFFTIGGHSLTALLLINSIRDHFGIELPLTVLFQKPTIAELCTQLDGETIDSSCFIPLQQGNGTNPPLILVHPQGGGILHYAHLVKSLGPQETVYGLQAVGYESDEHPLTSIEEMTELYISEIRRVVPHGPYRFVGWSFGGTVAFEMARQLEKIGEKVEFLGLFDVQPLDRDGDEQEEFTERDALVYFATLFDLDPQPFTWMEIEEGLHQLLQQAKKRGDWPQGMTLESMRRKINVLVACGQATTRYRYHGPINSDLYLFRVSHVSKHGHRLVNPEEWATRTTGKLQIFPVPGDHNTMGSPPHVDELAKAMKSAWAGISKSLTRGGV